MLWLTLGSSEWVGWAGLLASESLGCLRCIPLQLLLVAVALKMSVAGCCTWAPRNYLLLWLLRLTAPLLCLLWMPLKRFTASFLNVWKSLSSKASTSHARYLQKAVLVVSCLGPNDDIMVFICANWSMTCWLTKERLETVLLLVTEDCIVVSDRMLTSIVAMLVETLEMSCAEAANALAPQARNWSLEICWVPCIWCVSSRSYP